MSREQLEKRLNKKLRIRFGDAVKLKVDGRNIMD